MLYAQTVRGLSPTLAALLLAPMAIISGGLAPVVGKVIDRVNPKWVAAGGLSCLAIGLFWAGSILSADLPLWILLFPVAVLGLANAGIWAPLSTSATRNLPPQQAGAGSGVYNTPRLVGAVLGSAAIAALMEARLAVELPAAPGGATGETSAFAGELPDALKQGFSAAMGQSLLLPAAAAVIGVLVVLFMAKPQPHSWGVAAAEPAAAQGARPIPVAE
jgi:sugar phosphate permease